MLGKFPMDKSSKDVVTTYMSILESEAGIMPRAIHHIFQGLQRQVYKPNLQTDIVFFYSTKLFFSILIIQLK